jgi:hypothetical protein
MVWGTRLAAIFVAGPLVARGDGGWLGWLSMVGRELTLDRWEGGELRLVA